jgi:hypothetical protein
MKVSEDDEASKAYDGGTTSHTGQLFFDDAISEQAFLLEPYTGRPDERRTTNEADNILGDHEDEPGFMLDIVAVSDDWLTDGFTGTITVSVDPENISSEGMGGEPGGPGGAPPDGGPGGTPPDGDPGGPPPEATETTTA